MKKILCLILALALVGVSAVSCSKDNGEDADTEDNAVSYEQIDLSDVDDISAVSVSETETDYVMIEIDKFGTVVVRLFPEVAPKTVANFKKLVGEGFYDGLIFHRVIDGFMIQGGDPLGNGQGGSDEEIYGEFTSNGFKNNLKHTRGVISMARLGNDNNSATSQFFIVHKTSENNTASLDGKYASFGYVVYGMDVVDEIATVRTNSSDKPVSPVKMTSVKFANVTK